MLLVAECCGTRSGLLLLRQAIRQHRVDSCQFRESEVVASKKNRLFQKNHFANCFRRDTAVCNQVVKLTTVEKCAIDQDAKKDWLCFDGIVDSWSPCFSARSGNCLLHILNSSSQNSAKQLKKCYTKLSGCYMCVLAWSKTATQKFPNKLCPAIVTTQHGKAKASVQLHVLSRAARSTAFTITLCTDSAACTRPCNIHTQVSHFAVLVALLVEKVAREWLPLKKCFGQLFLLLRPSRGPISKTEKNIQNASTKRLSSKKPLVSSLRQSWDLRFVHTQTDRQTTIKVLWTPVGLRLPQE